MNYLTTKYVAYFFYKSAEIPLVVKDVLSI